MFDSDRPDAYEKVYQELIGRLAQVDWPAVGPRIGADVHDEGLDFFIFDHPVRVDASGVRRAGDPGQATAMRIICCHYVLRGRGGPPVGQWAAYRDFRDAAPFAAAYHRLVDESLGRAFSGRGGDLVRAAADLGGFAVDDVPGDVALGFTALPRVPLRLSFYEADEDFAAEARVLFDQGAEDFLDVECLAVTGYLLARLLIANLAPSVRPRSAQTRKSFPPDRRERPIAAITRIKG
jgi:hypothetical protein